MFRWSYVSKNENDKNDKNYNAIYSCLILLTTVTQPRLNRVKKFIYARII